jgi:chromosomal replication initiation ATPase DnaA
MVDHAIAAFLSAFDANGGAAAAACNPLVIVGPAGSGKSRLVSDLFLGLVGGSGPVGKQPGSGSSTSLMWDGRSLGSELAASLSHDTIDRLHKRFVSAAWIVIDGVEQITAWDTQRVLAHLFDLATDSGTGFLMTLRMHPLACRGLEPSLASRLSGGLIVSLPPHAGSRGGGEPPVASGGPPGPSLRRVINATARHHGLTAADLIGPSRCRQVAWARGMAMYLARRLTSLSLLKIGAGFGGRDHTTVLHGIRVTEERRSQDPGLAAEIDRLVETLLRR